MEKTPYSDPNSVAVSEYQNSFVITRANKPGRFLLVEKDSLKTIQLKESPLPQEKPLRTNHYSLFLGMICIDECYFLVFAETNAVDKNFCPNNIVRSITKAVIFCLNRDKKVKDESKLSDFKKYLEYGFYNSPTYDLSKPLHLQSDQHYDSNHFVWNLNIIRAMDKIGVSASWMDKIIQGFFEHFWSDDSATKYVLLSRRSCEMGGTRFNSRGINPEGFVANYVETEQFLVMGETICSFIILRGSPPFYWNQDGVLKPPKIIKPVEVAAEAYRVHFDRIKSSFSKISCINLMSKTKDGEARLSDFYQGLVQYTNMGSCVEYDHIDFHGVTSGTNFSPLNAHIEKHEPFIRDSGCFVNEKMAEHELEANLESLSRNNSIRSEGSVGRLSIQPIISAYKTVAKQVGVFRINCVDCLDRTNAFQSKLCFVALQMMSSNVPGNTFFLGLQLPDMDDKKLLQGFTGSFKNIWANHGDWVSKVYAGTGATTSSTTRKGSSGLLGLLDHKLKSVGRFFIGNFDDFSKQKAINILLGKTINEQITGMEQEIDKLKHQFTNYHPITIGVLSWASYFDPSKLTKEHLKSLLKEFSLQKLDLLVFGVQEMIKSSGIGLFQPDPKVIAEKYENLLVDYFAEQKDCKLKRYAKHFATDVLLLVFVRDTLVTKISHEFIDPVKLYNTSITGAFKKKNEAITYKFDLFDTSISLCNVHLFQGHGSDRAKQRKQEIEKVFSDTFKSDKFGMVRGEQTVQSADQIIFFGSLNFRPNMDEATVMGMCRNLDTKPYWEYTNAENAAISRILEEDEFESLRTGATSVLKGFSEGFVKFGPTYKFDTKTGTFVHKPGYGCAWADRILYSSDNPHTKCVNYGSVFSLKQSSHLPVFAVIETMVEEYDKTKREQVLTDFMKAQKLQEASLVIEDLGQGPQNPDKDLYSSYFYT